MYSTDVWGWVQSILTDPALAPFLAWDAQKISKFDRFYIQVISRHVLNFLTILLTLHRFRHLLQ